MRTNFPSVCFFLFSLLPYKAEDFDHVGWSKVFAHYASKRPNAPSFRGDKMFELGKVTLTVCCCNCSILSCSSSVALIPPVPNLSSYLHVNTQIWKKWYMGENWHEGSYDRLGLGGPSSKDRSSPMHCNVQLCGSIMLDQADPIRYPGCPEKLP